MKPIHQFLRARSSKKSIQFLLHIEFGVLSNNCQNYGICRIQQEEFSVLNNKQHKNIEKASATSIVNFTADGQIEIAFFRLKLEDWVDKKYFGGEEFIVEEDFSHLLRLENGVNLLFQIKKGNYAITKTLGFYIVKF